MRSFSRPAVQIPTLADQGVAGRKRNAHRLQYAANRSIPSKFDDHWNNADVRGLLHAMQSHVCAYCGLEDRTLDVEHFRPKGAIYGEPDGTPGYWWLAYEASNYFLGCPACNQKRKATRFPLTTAPRVTYDNRDLLSQEMRILLDPVEDAPVENFFHIEWSDPTCKIGPALHLTKAQQDRVTQIIDFFNLNLDATVRKRRSKAYEEAVRAASQERWDEVRRLAMRHREHSFVARFVLVELNQSLPTPEEEAEDLISNLWQDLLGQVDGILDLRSRGVFPLEQDLRQMKAYAWALIVLQKQGPPAWRARTETLLATLLATERNGAVREQIIDLFHQLANDLS
jgi:uncharacterized protein (TIGR02646 family)